MSFIKANDNEVSIALPRFIKRARTKLSQKLDDSYQRRLISSYAQKLESALADMVSTYGDDIRCRAIMRKHGLED